MESRINFIDLRNDTYAFEPGDELDKQGLSKVIAEAHRRGLIVFGTVNCGVSQAEYPAALKTFGEFIELGVDGLWISFDDKGPGDAPQLIVADVLELGRRHGITDGMIAVCPPKGSYQDIDTDFNRRVMGVPGMDRAKWFWTRYPSAASLAEARTIGLKNKPAWWHNWPRPYTPSAYSGPPSMAEGWHAPSYDCLADGAQYIDVVMPWGGNAWGAYYIVPVIGWWAWSPARHDWSQTRERIYRIVYGAGQIPDAMAFDDEMAQAKPYLHYDMERDRWQPRCPPRLKRVEDRADVLALTAKMGERLKRLQAQAPGQTMVAPEQLDSFYLDRMKAELATVDAAARAPYPEYWWLDHQREVLDAVYDNDLERADRLIASVRERILDETARVAQVGEHLSGVEPYVAWWKDRAMLDASGWQQLIEDRRDELKRRVWDYGYFVATPGSLLAPLRDPPLDWGTGRWQVGNRVLAAVLPTEREYAWGGWIGGVFRQGDLEAAVFAARRKSQSMPGEFSELKVELPLKGARRDRLSLLMFVNSANKDAIGGEDEPNRWAGYRYAELRWGERLIWEADLGRHHPGGEWSMVDLPSVPPDVETLELRLRVMDRRMSTVNHTIAFVGPIRLIERMEP
jgi:hypothetical protein